MKNQKLFEAIADIAYMAGERNFFSEDSRADISTFIYWAREFEKKNSKTKWYEVDYILTIEAFVQNKITEYRNRIGDC